TALRGVTIHPPLRTAPVVRALNAAHGGRACSTWGDFHYKTFDGDVFRFPGLCNYVFSAHCGSAYEDFNLQLRRGPGPNGVAPSRVTMKLDGLVVRLTKGSVQVNGRPIQLPFSQSGVLIEQSNSNLKVVAKLGLVFMWNQDDSLLLELDAKYTNQTCGLCGDFNGVPVYNEFFSHNVKLTPTEFGNLQKMDGPMEQCQDPVPEDAGTCSNDSGICEEMLSSEPFLGCARLVNTSSYLEACRHDLCHCSRVNLTSCLCHTLAEYSRQCAHAGGLPLDWRGPQLCPQTCPLNMQYHECGSPCADTCSNPGHSQLCEDHCVAGCFCPEGMVLDDISHAGCVPVSGCSCVYNGATYAPGTGYSTGCTNCTCSGGRWTCQEAPCPGTCSVLGGAHISTFDEKQYRVHGDCSYVLAKPCDSGAYAVLAELRRCGLTDSETCLKSLTLSLGHTVFVVKASGEVFVNQIYTQLPVSAANVTLFRPSTFFIIAQTQLGLQLDIQLVPIMQVFVRLGPQTRGQSCGLCGNFNQNQADDFLTISGVVEGSAAAFANTWKTQAACPNVKNSFEDPCSLSVENEKYAQHWCSRLTDPHGPFAQCHSAVDPSTHYSNCLFDTCNCEKSEDCMCAALSSYVRACAARGVLLSGWRDGMCTKPMATCPKSLTYRYNISTCLPTCRARSDEDVTCSIGFVPVDGCTCPDGTFLDDAGACVPATSCPCYFQGSVVPNGESLHEQGIVCSCTQGTLTCIGAPPPSPVCLPPMVYVDCRNATPGASGAGCQKSCHTLDMDCYSTKCEPGCVCPDGLVASGDGGCVPVSACPCVHNEASYQPGQTIRVGCNTCTCQGRAWQCTNRPCLATCAVYGDGHYLTFDGRRYSFSGDCEYTLLQDHCGGNGSAQDSFRVVTENVPCGTTGTTCSKAIKIFLGSYELKLSDGKLEVIETGPRPPYSIRQMGIYLVVDTEMGLVLLWDKGTGIFLRLSPEFKGRVCGLCGNFDDNALNDFTTRSQSVVGDVLEFGNSWKFSPSCPDALAPRDPCTANPSRRSWAQKQCSIINSATFSACHTHVEPGRYYEACVSDACACDSGGDCECFCTAVAAYAQACHEAGVCVSWRTPDICPLFCDYYNPQGWCQWHYQPCGAPCLKTCRNPSGQCWHDTQGLEGCYPECPAEAPIFDEDQMRCVASCPPPPSQAPCHVGGQSFWPNSTVPSDRDCYSCVCTEGGVQCAYDANACVCAYNGRHFHLGDVIYYTTDGLGGCISARCGANGTIERGVHTCSPTTPTPQTTFSFSTSLPGVSSTLPPGTHPSPSESTAHTPSTAPASTPGMASALPSPCCGQDCHWSPWLDVSRPEQGMDSGDFDTLENLPKGYKFCAEPKDVQCRAESFPDTPLQELGQDVICNKSVGLICRNKDQLLCLNYQIRVLCCEPREHCPPPTVTVTSTSSVSVTTSSTASAPTTSTISVQTSSTTSAPSTSPTPVHTSSTNNSTTISSTTSVLSTAPRSSEPSSPEPTTVTCLQVLCNWTEWIDGSYPGSGRNSGDFDTISNLRAKGYKFCAEPKDVQCRAESFPDTPLQELGQDVICNKSVGLICQNKDQLPPICYNYNIRFLCCELVDTCRTNTTSPATPATTQTPTAEASTTWATGTLSTSTKLSTASSPHVTPSRWGTPSTHEQSSPGTTPCKPKCRWTKWLDVDFPVPGPHGGDNETFGNIMRNGDSICHRPESISKVECRAENHPGVSIHELGQLVQCHQDVGLLCRNQDQKGKTRLCLNYQIRVLCCEPREHCPPPTVTVTSTSSVSVTVTTSVPTSETTPSPRSTVPCSCSVSGQLHPAGSFIYQATDLSGHCYYAFCNPDCQVVKGTAPTCPTSMPPPTPPATTSVPPPGCPNAVPPRTKGETWPMPNCSEATCQGNGVITVSPRHCPRVQKPTCANGYPAVQVTDHDGCCSHYQCPCVCSGWGDPHYITFDGTYYTFLDNCTYVLVQQIVPVFGHFRVLVENYFCDAEDGLSCPQSIIVEYHENRVMLTRKPVHGVMTNEIIFNGEVVRPGFQKGGIAVFQVGIKMYVSIPKLGVQVMFSGLIFSVEVPFSKFANNTEGQCGTCTNDQKDECRLPGGTVVASCSDMSGHWKVTYPGQPSCHGPPPTPREPGTSPTPREPGTSPTPCPPSPICQLILSKPFELCHVLIPPWPYYQGCTFDQCHMPGTDMVCTALELYAALCASLGVCVDWRGHTNSTCPFTCPAGMEYWPCSPPIPSYCYTNNSASPLALLEASPITEGCFCPQGTMLYSSSKEVCVPDCNSRFLGWGPRAGLRPGRTVSVDCLECTCEGSTQTMSCQPQACPTAPACPESGQVPVPEAMQTGQCCPQYRCACDTRYCPEPEACPKGSRAIQTHREAACCPTYNCSWTACSINGTLYQPGAVVSSSLCEKCWCELPGGALSDTFLINCETQICSTSCPVGFKYQARARQCCGECVQVACVINTSNSSAHLFYPGESWSDPGDHCVTHECEQHRDGLVVVTTKKACPPLNCPADKALPSEDGCCLFCPPHSNRSTCAVHHQLQVLRQQGCSSPGPVRLAYCRGNCGDTTSAFSPEANAVEHRCSCCRELRFSLRNVTLHCKDGSSRALTYTEVEECGCEGLQCDSPGGLGLSAVALEPSPESGLRRRVRRAPRARPLP
uniref:Mucin 5AC, oligomeric mucus/gel-forming n=1 Tax=Bos indicus x Bos taurus TaxID=30522 RepID=A0A4W2H2K7_BOBOX